MKKATEINKVLTFYVLANQLKTTIIDEVNNYSIADHLFGSMILAIAMESEFKEIKDIGKLLRMMLLSDFSQANPNYSIEKNLKKGKQYQQEIAEVNSLQTKEAKLILKYKMLDFSLTNLISKYENSLQEQDLLEEAMKIFMPTTPSEYPKYKEIFRFYSLNFRLKNKLRSGWDSKHWNINTKRIERISEHIIGTIALAIALDSEFDYATDKHTKRKVKIDKIIKTLAIHETGETLIGDITPFDGITPKQKEEIEHEAMVDAIGNLQDHKSLIEILFSFDQQDSYESKFSYLCDKIEADLQAKFYQDSGLQHSLTDQKNNCVFKSPKIQKMLDNGAKTAFDIWYEWDIDKFTNNAVFPEFEEMIKIAKENNLFTLSSFFFQSKDKSNHKQLNNSPLSRKLKL